MKLKILFFFGLFLALSTSGVFAQRQTLDYCQVFGGIYFVEDKNQAHFTVYIDEESGGLVDLLVYRQNNLLYADKSGQWFITQTKAQANYFVYQEERKSKAHFSIFYTDTESMAGCQ